MSKSLRRVESALVALGIPPRIVECVAETRTAEQAAAQAGCTLDQIVKSIVFGGDAARLFLFLTAGGNRVDAARASALAGCPLGRADPDLVRDATGFAIGGVAPVGHLTPLPVWMDPRLMDFDTVWAAAGTPRHIFAIAPGDIARATGASVVPFTA
jgi:prolyl-tRNA editing enzyme YbaK/EbsC (Cys-tRNA(Pro) deacylase)